MSDSERADKVRRALRIARLVGLALCGLLGIHNCLRPQTEILFFVQLWLLLPTAFIWVLSYMQVTRRNVAILACLFVLPLIMGFAFGFGVETFILIVVWLIAHRLGKRKVKHPHPRRQKVLFRVGVCLTVLCLAIWIVAGFVRASIGLPIGKYVIGAYSYKGSVTLEWCWDQRILQYVGYGRFKYRIPDESEFEFTWPNIEFGESGGYMSVSLPCWLLTLFFAVWSYVLWVRKRSLPPGLCDRCGYDLRGNTTGRCPECGTAYEEQPAGDATVEGTDADSRNAERGKTKHSKTKGDKTKGGIAKDDNTKGGKTMGDNTRAGNTQNHPAHEMGESQ